MFPVTDNLPRYFHLKHKYDEFGNISRYSMTSLYLDKTYYQFWNWWSLITKALIPFVVLITINCKILWKIKSSSYDSCDGIEFNKQNNGLRIHTR